MNSFASPLLAQGVGIDLVQYKCHKLTTHLCCVADTFLACRKSKVSPVWVISSATPEVSAPFPGRHQDGHRVFCSKGLKEERYLFDTVIFQDM